MYLASAVLFIVLATILIAVLLITWALLVDFHAQGLRRIRRAEDQWARDYALSMERHPAGRTFQ